MYTRTIMMIVGEMTKGERYWVASCFHQLGVTGHGRTRKAACEWLAGSVLDVARESRPLDGFEVTVIDGGGSTVFVTSNDPARLVSLMLRQQRTTNFLSLADVAEAAGAKSRNGYAQYEQGRSEPTIGKLEELLDIVAPDFVLAIIPRRANVDPRWPVIEDKELEAYNRDPSPENLAAFMAAAPVVIPGTSSVTGAPGRLARVRAAAKKEQERPKARRSIRKTPPNAATKAEVVGASRAKPPTTSRARAVATVASGAKAVAAVVSRVKPPVVKSEATRATGARKTTNRKAA